MQGNELGTAARETNTLPLRQSSGLTMVEIKQKCKTFATLHSSAIECCKQTPRCKNVSLNDKWQCDRCKVQTSLQFFS